MKNLIIYIIIVFPLFSCNKNGAITFRDSITQKEHDISDMLISKNGLESRKLEYLIAEDFDQALAITDSQQVVFDKIIQELKRVNSNQFSGGDHLKKAAVEYHMALKELYLYPKKEITWQKKLSTATKQDKDSLQHDLLEIYKDKQEYFQNVYKANEAYVLAVQRFNKENRL